MSKTASIVYQGNLRTEITHLKSGQTLLTDAPTDNHGLGESISPTDMVAAATVSCMMTIMGITAEKKGIELGKVQGSVQKQMASEPRRIHALQIELNFERSDFNDKEKAILERAALNCPVTKSIHPDISVNVAFSYGVIGD